MRQTFGAAVLAGLVACLLIADIGALAASPAKKPASPKKAVAKKSPAKKSPPALPAVLAGPLIRYIDTSESGMWQGSIMIATGATTKAPALTYSVGKSTKRAIGGRIATYKMAGKLYEFWRFQVYVATSSKATTVTYRIANVASRRVSQGLFKFVVAANSQPLKIAFYSGASQDDSPAYWKSFPEGGNTTWAQVLEQHAEEPFNLLLGVGNIVDNSGVLNIPQLFKVWWKNANRAAAWRTLKWTPALKKAVTDFYMTQYLDTYGTYGTINQVLAQVPQAGVYDHRDIFLGFRSHADLKLQASPVYKGMADVAMYFFRLFQMQAGPDTANAETFFRPGLSTLKYAGPKARLLLLDGLAERTPTRVISTSTYTSIFSRLRSLPSKLEYVYIATGQNPITSWRWTAASIAGLDTTAVSPFGDSLLATEVAGYWANAAITGERETFLTTLTKISKESAVRFAFLTDGLGLFGSGRTTGLNPNTTMPNNPDLIPAYAVGPIASTPGTNFVKCGVMNKLASTTTKFNGDTITTVQDKVFLDNWSDIDSNSTTPPGPLYTFCGDAGFYMQPVRGFGVVGLNDELSGRNSTLVSLWWEGPEDQFFLNVDDELLQLTK